jgi:transcription elongation factor GreA
MKNETPITKQGYEAVLAELDHLIKVEREEIIVAISEARELGDLKENAEYHAAKEQQGHVEGRIGEIQGKLATANVIDPTASKNTRIVFGATVTITHVENEETTTIQIVGEDEAMTDASKISFSSPLGKALIGKEEGDEAIVKAPKGNIEYEIEKVEYK